MPYDVTAGAILQVTFEGRLFGQQTLTVMNYILRDTATLDGPTLLEEAIVWVNVAGAGLYDKYIACLSEDVQLIQQHYQWIDPVRYAFVTNLPATNQGSIVNTAKTANISQVVTRRTERAGRNQISNLHLPGVPTEEVNAGLISDGHLTTLQAFGTRSVLPMDLGGFITMYPCPFRRSAPAEAPTLTTSYPQAQARDMRRRTVGWGS